jgi:hypothetical protein
MENAKKSKTQKMRAPAASVRFAFCILHFELRLE